MKNINIDDFKTYEDYKGMYIVEDYIRTKYVDTVLYATDSDVDAMDYMDDNDLWSDCTLYYVDSEGNATYPEF